MNMNTARKIVLQDITEEQLLEEQLLLAHLSDIKNFPDETLAPYEEFSLNGKIYYYFTPGGFLYRRDEVTEKVGGYFCGYLSDEVWHYRTDDG